MADAAAGADVLVHHRWRELLGRDALTRRFYRELETVVGTTRDDPRHGRARRPRAASSPCSARHACSFSHFSKQKDGSTAIASFCATRFDARCASGGEVHRRLLDPLFFGTLNTPAVKRRAPAARALGRIPFLNGGLFARTSLERRTGTLRFADESLGELIGGLLARYHVTAHESSSAWNEAAIDPEMLGRAFESLMAAGDRRSSGAFYTPSAIIERVGGEGLEDALTGTRCSRGARARRIRRRALSPVRRETLRVRSKASSARSRMRIRARFSCTCSSESPISRVRPATTGLSSERRRDMLTRSILAST